MSINIKRAIKARGLQVKEVADKMGMTPVGLSQHINGNPSVGVLERIAEALECDVVELFDPVQQQDTNTITCPHCGKKIVFSKKEEQGE